MSHIPNASATNSNHWLMALLCLLPLAGLVAIFIFNLPVSSVLLAAMVLACPVIHLFMMGQGGHASHKHDTAPNGAGAVKHRKES